MRGIPFIVLKMFVCLLMATAIIIMFLALAKAKNLDGRFAQSPNKEWFQGLKSAKGPCCSDADGQTVEPEDWKTQSKPGSHYAVVIEGAWWDVPDEAVLSEPNRVGRTIVWPIYNRSTIAGDRKIDIQIRCFMPGSFG
jgi:hypothetical protein